MNRIKSEDSTTQASSILSDERFDELFDLVSVGKEAEGSASLEAAEQEAVQDIQQVLGVLQAARPVTSNDLDSVEAQFLSLLAQEEPNHPWLNDLAENVAHNVPDAEDVEVKTLGDIVRLVDKDPPPWVSEEVWDFFSRNPTPISDLTDTAQRTRILGPVFKEAGISGIQIPKMFQWMTKEIGALIPGQNGAFVARRQKKPRGSR